MAARHEMPRRKPLAEAELDRNVKILARVLYRDLRSKGFSHQQIIAFVQELIGSVLAEMDASA